MKKFFSVILCVALVLSVLCFAGCNKDTGNNGDNGDNTNNNKETLKLGLGVYSEATKATNADGDTNGQGEVEFTAAAVLVDTDGKIVKCVVDTAQNKVAYTSEGKAIANDSFKTKYELGADYNMVAYGGAAKEWFEQADAFCALVVGKTAAEVKALVAEGDKGTDEVISAGCTIMIADFVYAVDAAVANATASDATADSTLKLGMYTLLEGKDATEDKDGESKLETTVFAAAVGADKKIIAASSDCVQVKFTFNAAGESTYDLAKEVKSKKQLGAAYNMSAYGADLNGDGTVKEWFEQAAIFDAACVGKTAGDVQALLADTNYGTAELQNAGCTILVNGFVAAAAKIG